MLPSPPDELMVKNGSLNDTSVTLVWKPGDDGGVKQTFVVQYRGRLANKLINITVNDNGERLLHYDITGLNPETDYVAYVFATNSLGMSNATQSIEFTTTSRGNIYYLNKMCFYHSFY